MSKLAYRYRDSGAEHGAAPYAAGRVWRLLLACLSVGVVMFAFATAFTHFVTVMQPQ